MKRGSVLNRASGSTVQSYHIVEIDSILSRSLDQFLRRWSDTIVKLVCCFGTH